MSNPTNGMAPRPQLQDLMRLIPAELQHSTVEEKMNYLKTLVARNTQQNAGQAVGSPQMRPSPRPRPPPNFAGQAAAVNNIQAMPNAAGQPPTGTPSNPTQSALINRLCVQAGITMQHFQTLNPAQQSSFIANQAAIMRQNANRAQGNVNNAPPTATPGRPPPGQPQNQASAQGLQPALALNGAGQNQAAMAANNPALQARLLAMRAQGQPIPQALQNQLAAVASQTVQAGGGGQMMNQSPRPPSEGLPGGAQGVMGPGGPGTPGAGNAQNQTPANQKQLQEIHNILSNLPEFMKMKEENRLSDQQKKMLDYIVKMKGPGTYGQLLNQQNANSQRNEQMQAQRQLNQQQQQRQQGSIMQGQPQDNLSLHSNQQQALFRQLQNMQQAQQQMAPGGDAHQVPGTPVQGNMTATPRPPAMSLNGQHGNIQSAGTPNSQGTSSPVTMGTPSGSTTSAITAAIAFKKIEEMSDEKRTSFFRNTPPIRRSYFTHIRGMPEEQKRELFTRKPAISAAYQEYIREVNMQQLRNAQQARQSPVNNNAHPEMGTPDPSNQTNDPSSNSAMGQVPGVPLPNLQLPPNRQRLLNQAQARQGQGGPGGAMPMQNGMPPMMGMNPQMQQAQNQASAAAAQIAAFKAQAQGQMHNSPSLPHGITQSPRSMHGTPHMGQNALASNMRGGTPNRVASLAINGLPSRQASIGGSPQMNSSPGMANANLITGMAGPTNGLMGVPGPMGQQQLQAQLAQIGQHAQAQLQANLQNQQGQPMMPLHTGGPMGAGGPGILPQQGMIPPPMPMGAQAPLHPGMMPHTLAGQHNQMQAAQMAQTQARGRPIGFPTSNVGPQQTSAECVPVSTEVQISQVLPASAKTVSAVNKYPDNKPLRTSLNGGLAAGMILGLPPHLQRPASMGRYIQQMQRDIATSGVPKMAMKGTIFEKLKSSVKEGDEVEEEAVPPTVISEGAVKEDKTVAPVQEEDVVEPTTTPNTGKRKLADLARCIYPEIDITESAEDASRLLAPTQGEANPLSLPQVLLEIADEFLDSCIEFGCRIARHRKARKLEVQDIQFHLGREYDINIPGFSSDAIRMDRLRNELRVAAAAGMGTRAQRLGAVGLARVQERKASLAARTAAGPGGIGEPGVVPQSKVGIKS